MKLIYALTGPDATRLLSEQWRRALREAGATRVQVNLDDEAVAEAMLRLSTTAEPVRAVVSVYTDGEAGPITRLVRSAAAHVTGWRVEEAVPLPPPPVADGERADALANVALLRIPPELDPATWRERWQGHHTQVAIDTQATFGYVQNLVVEALTPEDNPVAAIVEELFPMTALTDWHAFYGSGGDDAELERRMTRMLESTATFGAATNLDLVPTSRYVHLL